MSYKVFEHIGEWKNYWHIVGFMDDIQKKGHIKVKLYGVPLIIWKNNKGKLFAALDVCPHMKALLGANNTGNITCTYHGWTFASSGELTHIPSSPHLISKLKCKLNMLSVRQQGEFIYILIDKNSKSAIYSVDDSIFDGKWKEYNTFYDFETDEELLIENFMDATHTPIVHNKIVRDDSQKNNHTIGVQNTDRGVLVTFPETMETVGGFLSKLFRHKPIVSHTDEFILPNMVVVRYYINGVYRFQAHIACSCIEQGKTRAFVSIKYNFNIGNFILKFLLPSIAKKVLRQDYQITKLQYSNRNFFGGIKDSPIDYDIIHKYVQIIRKKAKQGGDIHELSKKKKYIKITV